MTLPTRNPISNEFSPVLTRGRAGLAQALRYALPGPPLRYQTEWLFTAFRVFPLFIYPPDVRVGRDAPQRTTRPERSPAVRFCYGRVPSLRATHRGDGGPTTAVDRRRHRVAGRCAGGPRRLYRPAAGRRSGGRGVVGLSGGRGGGRGAVTLSDQVLPCPSPSDPVRSPATLSTFGSAFGGEQGEEAGDMGGAQSEADGCARGDPKGRLRE